MRLIATLVLAFAPAFALPAAAQDLPGRVGRIAFIEGSAAVYQDPDNGWEKAYVNSPVTSENSVWTDPGSRAELRVGGTALRLDEATQVDIARLDDEEMDAFIPRGTVAVRVRHYDPAERLTFNTPHARFVVRSNGRYRIDVDPEREESRLTVFAGEASVASDSGQVRVEAGRTVRVFGGSSPSYVVERALSDPFDRWVQARDARWTESRTTQYVSPSMTGYEDLDSYGAWHEEPEVGALWFPTQVSSGWAPYRYGRWDYVRPWGWTWVDDAPWGYAPFHYGRWVYVRDRWGWHPGRREVRPMWAPALVAWIGGSNFTFGVSGGSPSVGWYPLSPWERFQPWYNANPLYVTNINIIVRNEAPRHQGVDWRSLSRDRGVTVVNRNVIVDRRPVQQALIAVRPEVVRQAQVTTPAIVLPPRNEVAQRRQAVRQALTPATRPGPTQTTQRGEPATPAVRPEFNRRQAATPVAPQPARTAPPPAQRVAPPQQPARERDAQQQPSRDTQQQARDAQQRAREQREVQQPQQRQRAEQERAAREVQQQRAREQREAQQAQQRQRVEPERAQPPQPRAQPQERTQQQQEQAQQQQLQRAQQAQERAQQQQQQQQRAQQQRQEREKAKSDKDKDDDDKKSRGR